MAETTKNKREAWSQHETLLMIEYVVTHRNKLYGKHSNTKTLETENKTWDKICKLVIDLPPQNENAGMT